MPEGGVLFSEALALETERARTYHVCRKARQNLFGVEDRSGLAVVAYRFF